MAMLVPPATAMHQSMALLVTSPSNVKMTNSLLWMSIQTRALGTGTACRLAIESIVPMIGVHEHVDDSC